MNKKKFKMIDTHIHIIPGVDDGATDFLMARNMLEKLIEQGVTELFATSHSDSFLTNPQRVMDQYEKLNVLVEETNLPMKLHLGSEVYCEASLMEIIIQGLNDGTIPSLNGTKYVLTEFYYIDKKEALYCLTELLTAGWIPVIAHAERYRELDIPFYMEMKKRGCLIQMNVFSVGEEANVSTRELANQLLESRLVDFLGSDSHRTTHRPPKLTCGLEYLKQNFDEAYIEAITYKNAERLLMGSEDDANEE